MIYLKYVILYSIIGFYFESSVFKLTNNKSYSGILNGPYTMVYGIGGLISYIINIFFEIIKNPYLNIIVCYISFVIICTIIEFLAGHLIKYIFKVDSWNYSKHKYHFGKYVCLDYSLIWGILALIFVKFLNSYFDKILLIIPNFIPLSIIILIILDFIRKLKRD